LANWKKRESLREDKHLLTFSPLKSMKTEPAKPNEAKPFAKPTPSGIRLKENDVSRDSSRMPADVPPKDGFRCPYCGASLDAHATACTECDWVRPIARLPNTRFPRNPRDTAAAVLSIVPGLGHFFKGYRLAGALILFLGVPIIGIFAFAFTMFVFGWTLVPVYWVAVAMDAFFRRDRNLSLPPPRHH
jgi:hypothetical protein